MSVRRWLKGVLAVSAWVSAAPTPGRASKPSLNVGDCARTYVLHVPPSYDGKTPLPLIIALHHFTGSGRQMQRLTGLDAIADREGFIVAYPDGLKRRWNLGWDPYSNAGRKGPDDLGFISGLVDHLSANYAIDATRVYATGGSNGAMLAQYLACKIPRRFAAIASIYGTAPRNITKSVDVKTPISVLIMHGTDDPILPWNGSGAHARPGTQRRMLSALDNVQFWVERSGCTGAPVVTQLPKADPRDGTTVERTAYASRDGETEVVLYAIRSGGHTWPGSKHNWSRWIVGRTSYNVDASEAVWEFFKRHARTEQGQGEKGKRGKGEEG